MALQWVHVRFSLIQGSVFFPEGKVYPHLAAGCPNVPVLPFLVFLARTKEKHPKKTRIFIATEPPKSLEKKRETLKKTRNSSVRGPQIRAALKGTNLRGQTPICGFLRFPAKICGFLRKSAVSCENLRFPNALFSRKRGESAKICENLRKSEFGIGLSP